MTATENLIQNKPDISISVNQAFGIDTDLHVEGFSKKSEYVPDIDSSYCFDKATTMAVLSGFKYNRRVSPGITWYWKIYPYRTNCCAA